MSIFDDLATTDFDEVSTAYPNIAPGVYEFQIKEATKEQSARGGEYLCFKCTLVTDDATDTDGNPINVGYQMRHMINLTPSQKQLDKNGEEGCRANILKDVKKFLEAIGAEGAFDPTLESYVGANFFAKTRVSKERADDQGNIYAPSAEFAQLVPAQ